jgi:hypothetical protein
MSLLTLEARAKKIFAPYNVTPEVRDRYEQDWLRSVITLGDRWLFAKYAEKLTPEQQGLRDADGTYRVTPSSATDSHWGNADNKRK